jgi:nucleotide-binding universal stress UspA family protein
VQDGGNEAITHGGHMTGTVAEDRGLAATVLTDLRLRRILCAADLSPSGAAALGQAAMVARLSGAEVVVLTVNLTAADRARLEHDARRLAGGLRPGVQLAAVGGDPAAAILGVSRRLGADLVVLGAGERAPYAEAVLGSVARVVLKDARCPVLTVPRTPDEAAPPRWRRILCPVNFSPAAERSAVQAARLARLSGAELTFLHVLEWFAGSESGAAGAPFHVPELQLDLEDAARRRLRTLLPDVEADVLVTGGEGAHQILRVARERASDLVVLGAHGRRAADLIVSGPTARRVVRGSSCPVLTVRLT